MAASSIAKSAASKIDWSLLPTQLGLKGSTLQALSTFKKRHDDAKRRVQTLSEQPTTVDFSSYRALLKNSSVVDEMERQLKSFSAKKYDVERQIRAIETFEAQGLKSAQETKGLVDKEVGQLRETLERIQGARAFEELTVDEVVAARPEIDEKVSQLVQKGKWDVPGYKNKFGDLSVI